MWPGKEHVETIIFNISDYTFALSHILWETPPTITVSDASELENYYQSIVVAITTADKETLPHKTFKHFLNPYWSTTLKENHKAMRQARSTWLSQGRHRGMEHPSYKYKQA